MRRESLLHNFNYNLIALMVNNVFLALGVSVVSRVLGPTDYGSANAVISFVSIFMALIYQGSNIFFTREYTKNRYQAKNFLTYTLNISFAIAVLLMFFSCFKMFNIPLLYQMAFIFILSFAHAIDFTWLFRAKESTKIIALSTAVASIIHIVLIYILSTFLTPGLYLLIFSITKLLNSIIILFLSREVLNDVFHFLKRVPSLPRFKEDNIGLILALSLSGVFGLIYIKSDVVILGLYNLNYEAGIYASAMLIINFLYVLRGTLLSALVPPLHRKYSNSIMEYKVFMGFTIKLGGVMGALIVGVLLLSSEQIIRLVFGNEYLLASDILDILLFAVLFLFLNMGVSSSLIVTGEDKAFIFMNLLSALVNVSLNLLLIPIFGMYAAAITSVIAEASVLIFSIFYLRYRYSELNMLKIFLRNSYKIFLLLFFSLLPILMFMKDANYFLQVSMFIIVFGFVLYFGKILNKKDLDLLLKK